MLDFCLAYRCWMLEGSVTAYSFVLVLLSSEQDIAALMHCTVTPRHVQVSLPGRTLLKELSHSTMC